MRTPIQNRRNLFHLFALGLLYFVFFKPALALTLHQPFDEACYIEWLSPFIGVSSAFCYSHSHLSGIVALWFPFGQIGKWLASFFQENPHSWICFLVGASSFLFLGVSLLLLDKTFLAAKLSKLPPKFFAVLVLLNIPVLHYAVNDAHLVHAGELLLSTLVIFFLAREAWWYALAAGFLLCVTRINDAPVLFLILGHYLDRSPPKSFSKLWLGLALLLTALILWLCYDIGFVRGYNQTYFFPLVQTASWHKLGRLFFAQDWGLLWTAPGWLILFFVGLSNLPKSSWSVRGAWLWMLVEFLVVAVWRGNGRYFGHRYLIGSYLAAIWIWIDLGRQNPGWFRKSYLVLTYTALWLSYLTWICLTHLWPWPIVDNFDGWGVPFVEALKVLTFQSRGWFGLFQQSPLPFVIRTWGTSTDVFTKTQDHFIAVCTASIAAFTVFVFGKLYLAALVRRKYRRGFSSARSRVSSQSFSKVEA